MDFTFLTLVPITDDARAAVGDRYNTSCIRFNIAPPALGYHCDRVAEFAFSAMFGRRYLSFGKSHSSQLVFSDAVDLASCHFVVDLDTQERRLVLRDTSSKSEGIWYRDRQSRFQRVPRSTNVHIQSGGVVAIGRRQRIRFAIFVDERLFPPNDDFPAIVQRYLSSVEVVPPATQASGSKRRRISAGTSLQRSGVVELDAERLALGQQLRAAEAHIRHMGLGHEALQQQLQAAEEHIRHMELEHQAFQQQLHQLYQENASRLNTEFKLKLAQRQIQELVLHASVERQAAHRRISELESEANASRFYSELRSYAYSAN